MPAFVPVVIRIRPPEAGVDDGAGFTRFEQQLESSVEDVSVLALIVAVPERVSEGKLHRYGSRNPHALRDVRHHRDHHRGDPGLLDAVGDQDDRPAAIWSGGGEDHGVNGIVSKLRDHLGQVTLEQLGGIELEPHERIMARSDFTHDALALELT